MRRLIVLLLLGPMAACGPLAPGTGAEAPAPTLPVPDISRPVTGQPPAPEYRTSTLVTTWDRKTGIHQLLPVEPSSGAPVPGFAPIPLGGNYYYAFGPDGLTLAALGYKTDNPHNPILHVIDLAGWQETQTELDLTGWAYTPVFSPDGRYLAIGANYSVTTLLVFDLKDQRTVAKITPDFDIVHLKFTSDGSGVMAYGRQLINRFTASEQAGGPARAALYDAQDLTVLWSVELDDIRDGIYPADAEGAQAANLHQDPASAIYFYPGLAFAPDRDRLYVVHADQDRLTTIDFEALSVTSVDIRPKLSWFEQFLMFSSKTVRAKVANGTARQAAISPDGSTLYTAGGRNSVTVTKQGDWEYSQSPIGLQAIDVESGYELFKIDTGATVLWITTDGRSLLLQNWDGIPSTLVVDAEDGRITAQFEIAMLVPARRMDGTPLLVSAVTSEEYRTDMSAFTADGNLLGRWQVNGYGDWLIAP